MIARASGMTTFNRLSRAGSGWTAAVESLVAVTLALLIGALVLALAGHDPVNAYGELVRRTLLRPAGLQETVVRAIPLLLAAVPVLLAVKAGLWNIGVDGQVLVGALAAAVTAHELADAGRLAAWSGSLAAALLAGALWALVPALLRARWAVNEIVTTIMFNYVALSLTAWLVKGPLRDDSIVSPQTPLIPRELRFPPLWDSRVHAGIALAVLVWAGLGLWLRYTVAGFETRALGAGPRAARHALIPVGGLSAGVFVASGALSALAGANDVLATKGTFQAEWNPAYGLSAFVLVFLARQHIAALLPAALFLGMLGYGADVMPRAAGIPSMYFPFLEGVLLVILAVAHWRPWPGWIRARS